MDDPTALVLAYIADHHRWNTLAYERSERAGRSNAAQCEAIEAARRGHAELLARYCRPGFKGQPCSFGVPPLHDPACESVVSSGARGERCLVRTRMVTDLVGVVTEQEFEYRLCLESGRWWLESVKCVVEGRRYETL